MIAILIGATGLVGRELLVQLLADPRFSSVLVFSRRATGLQHAKLKEHIISFDKISEVKSLIKGDVLFSALGTTIKSAGSKDRQYLIDHTYQYEFSRAASDNNVPVYVLVSSAGANEKSSVFYNRMKGELEKDILKLNFKSVYFIRPSLIAGNRKENRTGEKIGFVLLNALNTLGILRKYRPVHASVVAKAMINASLVKNPGLTVSELQQVFELAGKN